MTQHLRRSAISIHVVAYLFSKAAPAAAMILLTLLLVRAMDASSYTSLGHSMAFVNAVIAFGAGWVNQSQIRFIEVCNRIPLSGRFIAVLANINLGIIAIFLWSFSSRSDGWLYEAFLYVAMLVGLVVSTEALAYQRSSRYMWMELCRSMTLIATVFIAIATSSAITKDIALICIATSYLIPLGIPALLGRVKHLRPNAAEINWKEAVAGARAMWRYGWPLGLWICLVSLMQVLDRFAMDHAYGSGTAAQYIALFEVYFRGTALLLFPFVMASFPEMIKRWGKGEHLAAIALVKTIIKLHATLLLPLAGLCSLTSDWSTIVFGNTMQQVDPIVIALLVAGSVIWQIALIAHKPLELTQHTRLMLGFAIVALIVFAAVLFAAIAISPTLVPLAYVFSGLAYWALCAIAFRTIKAELA
jgi:O-antigen/teichoic acid export membrane protein